MNRASSAASSSAASSSAAPKEEKEEEAMEECPLCGGRGVPFAQSRRRSYLLCAGACKGAFMARRDRPAPAAERARYEQHNNSADDPRYARFLAPLVSAVVAGQRNRCCRFCSCVSRDKEEEEEAEAAPAHCPLSKCACGGFGRGIDFGSGPTPAVATLLRRAGACAVALYDPFFAPDKDSDEDKGGGGGSAVCVPGKYDFAVCCEVAEHFWNPRAEWRTLRALLRGNGVGRVYAMTDILTAERAASAEAFARWSYTHDQTHVFFYSPAAIEWIRADCGFATATITADRVIVFSL